MGEVPRDEGPRRGTGYRVLAPPRLELIRRLRRVRGRCARGDAWKERRARQRPTPPRDAARRANLAGSIGEQGQEGEFSSRMSDNQAVRGRGQARADAGADQGAAGDGAGRDAQGRARPQPRRTSRRSTPSASTSTIRAKYEQAEPMFQFICMYAHDQARYWMALGNCRQMAKQYQRGDRRLRLRLCPRHQRGSVAGRPVRRSAIWRCRTRSSPPSRSTWRKRPSPTTSLTRPRASGSRRCATRSRQPDT